MREIKFRAWDKSNEEMLEVENLSFNDMTDKVEIRTRIYSDYFNDEEMILMQYTGLKDKNGKEIYEGDIVTAIINIDFEEDLNIRGSVIYDDGETCYKAITKENDEYTLGWLDYLEVIGNIYENPELLEVKE